MRLLICTQVVDKNDPHLGFFHRWIEEFAQHSEYVIVVCLRKGVHSFSKNVEVISLGDTGKFLRALELCTIAFGRRSEYDVAFVHMNPEFIAAAGWLWRLLHKKIALWYTHKSVDVKLKIAERLANVIFTASKESFRLPSSKVHVVGHGIDTEFFCPDESVSRGTHILSAGRLMKSKRHDLSIRAAKKADRPLRIAGEGEERKRLEQLVRELGADVTFLGGLSQTELRDEYRRAACFVHTSTTGSLDKVVLEAAACGCTIITTVKWLREYVPVHNVDSTPEAIADAIQKPKQENTDCVAIIREHHALVLLIKKIIWMMK